MRRLSAFVIRRATILANESDSERIGLELDQDSDGAFRWYEEATGANTEVSGASIAAAIEAGERAWSGPRKFELKD